MSNGEAMTGIVERLRSIRDPLRCFGAMEEAADEIERLQIDKAAISQTASDYLHEIERLTSKVRK